MNRVSIELGSVERGWCHTCRLPSLIVGPVQILTDDGLTEIGVWSHCTEHDRDPAERVD